MATMRFRLHLNPVSGPGTRLEVMSDDGRWVDLAQRASAVQVTGRVGRASEVIVELAAVDVIAEGDAEVRFLHADCLDCRGHDSWD